MQRTQICYLAPCVHACMPHRKTDLGHGQVGLVRDDGVLHLDAHLVVLIVGGRTGVLLVGTTTLAATVIEDGDHRSAARLQEVRRIRKQCAQESAVRLESNSTHAFQSFMKVMTDALRLAASQ